jgi:hypothetical protein
MLWSIPSATSGTEAHEPSSEVHRKHWEEQGIALSTSMPSMASNSDSEPQVPAACGGKVQDWVLAAWTFLDAPMGGLTFTFPR